MNPDVLVYMGTVAAIGFVLKCAILFNVEIRNRISQSFVVLCLFFIVQNAAEFLAYFTYLKSVPVGEFFFHVYMNSLFYIFPAVVLLALALIESRYLKVSRYVMFGVSIALSGIYLSDQIVTSVTFVGWSAIAGRGPLYWLAFGYILFCVALTIAILLLAYRTSSNAEIRHNARIYLLAFSPIVAVAIGVLGFRALGFESSSAISLPVATLLFLYIMLLHTNGNLFWLSTKFKSVLAVLRMDRRASVDSIIREIEKVRIQEALKQTNGQQKSAAELLGLPASTLNKRLTKYNIKVQNFK